MPEVVLADGRTLAYRAFGDPGGRPVVNCHGGLVSGLDVAPYDAAARQLGVRIISPNRPGIGGSSPQPGRTTLDWARDVGALLNGLALPRASVLGWSMGGQYTLACGAQLADRIDRVVSGDRCSPVGRATSGPSVFSFFFSCILCDAHPD